MVQSSKKTKKRSRIFTALWSLKPLQVLLIIAFMLRLIAAFFSKGYVVHDDHFMTIETAQAWVDGTDYKNWLPGYSSVDAEPIGQSFTYVGIHYFLFELFDFLGIDNANSKMLIVRILHALFSLLVIGYTYRITHLLSNKHMARYVGLLMATFWILPFASVHNFAEMFAVPFFMLSTWFLLRPQYRTHPEKWSLFSGLSLGMAFSVWFFGLIFVMGVLLVMTVQKKWKSLLFISTGFLISAFLFQGLVDYFIWGQPFAEFSTFVNQLEMPFTRPNRTVFSMYILILVLVIIPPISLFWLAGWINSARKYFIIFLPSFLVFIFFSVTRQQHERFIMTVFPFIIIGGVLGWDKILQRSVFWCNRPGLYKSILMMFWVVNFLLLLPVSTMYSKKGQVESMLYLQKHKDEVNLLLVEDTNRDNVNPLPLFYTEKWVKVLELAEYNETKPEINIDTVSNWQYEISHPIALKQPNFDVPDYVLFIGKKRLDERVQKLMYYLPDIAYKKTIKPGVIDRLLYKLNPKYNINETIYIYKVPDK